MAQAILFVVATLPTQPTGPEIHYRPVHGVYFDDPDSWDGEVSFSILNYLGFPT